MDPISFVMNTSSGIVDRVYVENGMQVMRGDVLYRLEMHYLELINEGAKYQLLDLEEDLENLRIYRTSVELEENLFTPDEERYYTLVEKFLTEIVHTRLQIGDEAFNFEGQLEGATLLLEEIDLSQKQREDMMENLELYRYSINIRSNLFTEGQYHIRYTNFELRYNRLQSALSEARILYEGAIELFYLDQFSEDELRLA